MELTPANAKTVIVDPREVFPFFWFVRHCTGAREKIRPSQSWEIRFKSFCRLTDSNIKCSGVLYIHLWVCPGKLGNLEWRWFYFQICFSSNSTSYSTALKITLQVNSCLLIVVTPIHCEDVVVSVEANSNVLTSMN